MMYLLVITVVVFTHRIIVTCSFTKYKFFDNYYSVEVHVNDYLVKLKVNMDIKVNLSNQHGP